MIALFFHMVLATISQIDGVNRNLVNVTRTVGATKRQIYRLVIIPAILPGLLMVLRLKLPFFGLRQERAVLSHRRARGGHRG